MLAIVGAILVAGGLVVLLMAREKETNWPVNRTPLDWYLGPSAPSIVVTEYGDYECPPCVSARRAVEGLRRARADVGFVYRHFPTRHHPNAVLAAEAAEAAGAQGKYWEMHALLLERQAEWYLHGDALTSFRRYAAELGLDPTRFDRDVIDHRYRRKILAAKEAAAAVGVRNAPVFFIGGRRLRQLPRTPDELIAEVGRGEQLKGDKQR